MNIRLELRNSNGETVVFGGYINEPTRFMMLHSLQNKIDIEFVASDEPLTECDTQIPDKAGKRCDGNP